MTRRRRRELEIKRRTVRWPRNHWCSVQPTRGDVIFSAMRAEMESWIKFARRRMRTFSVGDYVFSAGHTDASGDTITIASPGELPPADAIVAKGALCP